jgi:hypothetical protein
MPTVNDLHPQAMDLAELAFLSSRKGDEGRAKELFLEALKLEQQAAALLPPNQEAEPSRSILYRSAASLAFNGGDYETADWLIANGLSGFPPPEIREELKNLYDDINFMRHLSAKGMELNKAQWLMTLAGNATSHGSALVDHLLLRVDRLSTIFYRTVERLLKRPYRTSGGVSKEIKDQYGLYVNALLPSSFAVSFQLGQPSQQMILIPGLEVKRDKDIEPDTVIDEVLKCFEILESSKPDTLRERFDDEVYYVNFVGLAKQMAPDGEEIKVVGFTTIRNGKEKPLALRKSQQQLRETKSLLPVSDEDDETVVEKTYKGILRFANSPATKKFGTVKLTDNETGNLLTIKVPIALMKDVVQPFFEERVTIVVHEKGDDKYLEEVSLDTT